MNDDSKWNEQWTWQIKKQTTLFVLKIFTDVFSSILLRTSSQTND